MSRKKKNDTNGEWRNRIVGYGEVAPDQLLAHESNWRTHPKSQQDALSSVLNNVGIVQSVICNRATGKLVDGHLRVMLAMREGIEKIPVVYVDLSPSEEATILATLDPIAALAGVDEKNLQAVLKDATEMDRDLRKLLFDEDEKTLALLDQSAAPDDAPDGADEGARDEEEAQANVASGEAPPDDAQALLVIAHCADYQQQVDALNALRALGIEAESKP